MALVLLRNPGTVGDGVQHLEYAARSLPDASAILASPSALARNYPTYMRCSAYQVVCGVREYAESHAVEFGSAEQAHHLDAGIG